MYQDQVFKTKCRELHQGLSTGFQPTIPLQKFLQVEKPFAHRGTTPKGHFGYRYAGSRILTELLKCRSPKENRVFSNFFSMLSIRLNAALKEQAHRSTPLKEENA